MIRQRPRIFDGSTWNPPGGKRRKDIRNQTGSPWHARPAPHRADRSARNTALLNTGCPVLPKSLPWAESKG